MACAYRAFPFQISRMGRLAHRAKSEWFSTEATDDPSGLSQGHSQPSVIVGVELASLVVVVGGEGRGRGRRVLPEDGEEQRNGRLKDFKRFRKVQ